MIMNVSRILIFSILIVSVRPHGRLIEPPSRSTMWRWEKSSRCCWYCCWCSFCSCLFRCYWRFCYRCSCSCSSSACYCCCHCCYYSCRRCRRHCCSCCCYCLYAVVVVVVELILVVVDVDDANDIDVGNEVDRCIGLQWLLREASGCLGWSTTGQASIL